MNYNLVVNTDNFKPYTFDDLVKPVTMYKEDYNNLETKMEDYVDKYGSIVLPSEVDLKYRGLVDLYNSDLRGIVDAMTSNAPLASYRNNATRLFLRGRNDLAPIKKALEEYTKQMNELSELKKKDSSTIITKQPDLNAIIGDYLGAGTTSRQYNTINGKEYALIMSAGVSSLMKQLPDNIEVKSIGGDRLLIISSSLMNAKDILDLVRSGRIGENSSLDVQKVAKQIMDYIESTRNSYGYYNTDDETRSQLDSWMERGIIASGIGDSKSDVANAPRSSAETEAQRRARLVWERIHNKEDGSLRADTIEGQAEIAKRMKASGKSGDLYLPYILAYDNFGVKNTKVDLNKDGSYKSFTVAKILNPNLVLSAINSNEELKKAYEEDPNKALHDWVAKVKDEVNERQLTMAEKELINIYDYLKGREDLYLADKFNIMLSLKQPVLIWRKEDKLKKYYLIDAGDAMINVDNALPDYMGYPGYLNEVPASSADSTVVGGHAQDPTLGAGVLV